MSLLRLGTIVGLSVCKHRSSAAAYHAYGSSNDGLTGSHRTAYCLTEATEVRDYFPTIIYTVCRRAKCVVV